MRSVLILYLAFCVASLSAAPLTVERIFSAPNLAGPSLRAVKVSPDGRYVTYLQGKPENKDQLDLWAFDLRSGTTRALVDSNAFIEGAETLSAAEEARRERLRISGLR
ncbi:MAG: S9 family peptidase, partial [Candidatus Obscuribacterales bacterium]|nr:S9 family peptidase [Steroidobacteraceae bacterium]